ncbi:TPA: hypothetical protein DD445_02895 [Candidatus Nomurabacteria bacterium]|nr:hypothetical protein [Candidatus Nomurabacteria bacterium]HBP27710.1 hypothetical protein [Candidatus Nomurabacteria bacterium]HBR66032.1 hypothetical protein [Candidatus Nomurabacteria bacterium]
MSAIVKVLVLIGGINWGLVGLGMLLGATGGWNVVNIALGSMPILEAIIYTIVGVASIMIIFDCKCEKCVNGVCTPCSTTTTETVEVSKIDGNV